MNPSEWQAVTELFHAARERQRADRQSFLSEHCAGNDALRAEVEDLLRADDEAQRFLGGDAVEQALRAIDDGDQQFTGTIVGSYRILQEIGHGGMGAVYLAERIDDQFQKRLAVKLIKRGMDTDAVLRRFHDERKILAELDHPNIARLIDGGTTTDGRPYFLMEYVDGQPIDRYCDQRRLGVDERLRLFLKVCEAVSYAHRHLVIHRDIKPSNILVMPDGSPKLLDFGIAKVMHAGSGGDTLVTAAFMRPMTPEYSSPEQLQGAPSTTLSDVYSLGVLLFEMLVGATPFQFPSRAPDDIVRVLTAAQAPTPSEALTAAGGQRRAETGGDAIASVRGTTVDRLRRRVAGDLDTIVSMALRAEPERRYQSVEQLAEDIGRHLSGLPILARKDQALYRARKFVRRHQAGVGAALLVFATVVFGFGATIWQAIRATRAERAAVVETKRADSEAAMATAVSEFLQNDLLAQASSAAQAGLATTPDPNLTVRAALDRAAARIGGKFADRPEIEVAIRRTIGMTYSDLGRYAEAEEHLKRAVELQQRVLGAGHADTLATMSQLGMIYGSAGKNSEAEALMSTVLAEQRRLFGEDDIRTMDAMNNLAIAVAALGRHTEAERLYQRMLAIERRVNGEEHADTLAVMNNLAVEYISEGRYAQAEDICKQTLALKRRVLGDDHPSTLRTSNQLGIVYRNEGKYEDAETLLSSTLAARRRVMGPDHVDTITNLNSLALVYQAEEKYTEAEPLLVQVIESRRRLLGQEHPLVIASMTNLADLNRRQGKLKDAETRFAEVLELRRRVLGPDHPNTLSVVTSLAAVKFDQRDYPKAEGFLRAALSGYERRNADNWQRYYAQSLLGAILLRRERRVEAAPLLTAGYQGLMSRESAVPVENRSVLDDARQWLAEIVK